MKITKALKSFRIKSESSVCCLETRNKLMYWYNFTSRKSSMLALNSYLFKYSLSFLISLNLFQCQTINGLTEELHMSLPKATVTEDAILTRRTVSENSQIYFCIRQCA